MKQNVKHTLLLLSIPALELLCLRLFLHYTLNLKIGFLYTTDFDYFIPAPVGFFLLVCSLKKNTELKLFFNRNAWLLNLLSVSAFISLNLWLSLNPESRSPLFWTAWFLNLVVIIVSALCLFVSHRFYFQRKSRIYFLPALLVTFAFPFYLNTYEYLWSLLGSLSAHSLENLFHLFWRNQIALSYTGEGFLQITHRELSVIVGRGCIGMESLLLFSCAYFVVFSLSSEHFSKLFLGFFLVGGLAFMFGTNLVRVVLLFWSGIWLRKFLGFEQGTLIFKTLVHAQLGWLLYICALSLYFGASFFALGRLKSGRPILAFQRFWNEA